MAKPIGTRFALGKIEDLTTESSTQLYPLGMEVVIEDSDKKCVKKYIYIKAHGTLTAYVPYVIGWTGTAAAEVKTAAPATCAAPGQIVCVHSVGMTSGYFGFVQIQGDCTVNCANETKAVGDYLQLLNGGTTLVVDGTTSSTVLSANSCAISKSATTDGTSGISVVLLGRWAVTAAS